MKELTACLQLSSLDLIKQQWFELAALHPLQPTARRRLCAFTELMFSKQLQWSSHSPWRQRLQRSTTAGRGSRPASRTSGPLRRRLSSCRRDRRDEQPIRRALEKRPRLDAAPTPRICSRRRPAGRWWWGLCSPSPGRATAAPPAPPWSATPAPSWPGPPAAPEKTWRPRAKQFSLWLLNPWRNPLHHWMVHWVFLSFLFF